MVFSMFDVIKKICGLLSITNIKCLVNITFYKEFIIKCRYLCKYLIHIHGYFSYAFFIYSAKTWIIMSFLRDKSNIVGVTDCYQPQVKLFTN